MMFPRDSGGVYEQPRLLQDIINHDATSVKVLPRPIPLHYVDKVHNQLQEIEQEEIIRPSKKPWYAPAVYALKSNGEPCIDFV